MSEFHMDSIHVTRNGIPEDCLERNLEPPPDILIYRYQAFIESCAACDRMTVDFPALSRHFRSTDVDTFDTVRLRPFQPPPLNLAHKTSAIP
jgi:hypothetical protein